MTCVVVPSSRSLRVMLPLPATMASSKVATMLAARDTPVALSGGDLRVMTGAVRSCAAVLKVQVTSSVMPAKAFGGAGGVFDRIRADLTAKLVLNDRLADGLMIRSRPESVTWASGRVMMRSDEPEGSPRLRRVIVPPGFSTISSLKVATRLVPG
jgi:hypothetical protein